MDSDSSQHSGIRNLLLGIFIVSGFTGLIYESIWSHYLKLFLGHAAYAQTLVLAIFMAGMAGGSWIVARYTHAIRQLLIGYALVEGITGVLALIFHRFFVGVTDFSFETIIPELTSPAAANTYKWSLAAALILPQSILLGMTFPLISGGIIRRWPQRPGEILSVLYFTNSLGAALGVLTSGFLLIKWVGLPGTVMTAGLLNIILAIAVWSVVRTRPEPPAPMLQTANFGQGKISHRWLLIAAFATGAASFMYEIGWIRMLSLVLGSSTHSFELMLSAFILGLACGGLWMRKRIERIADPLRYLGFTMLAMGAAALLTVPAYNKTFDFMAWVLSAVARTDNGYVALNLISQMLAGLIMIPTTFLAGMTLPLLTNTLMRSESGERAIGSIYAANTLGAIVGVALAAHMIMPALGIKGVILMGAALHMLLGISGLMLAHKDSAATKTWAGVICAALFVWVTVGVHLDPMRMTSGVYRTGSSKQPETAQVRYLRDGKTATISLVEQNGVVLIATNGKVDAAIRMGQGPASPDEITMILAAALPLSMHPNPQRIANIGFGSGLTSHTLLGSQHLKRLDSIEIEPRMVEAARQGFHSRIERVFSDPRSHIFYEDAKTFFASTREPYDIIISEPSNPWVSGVATLFSTEFYRRISRHLKPDGYLVQWLQIYETDISIVASVLKAISSEFSDYAIYNADDANLLIVATRATLSAPNRTPFASEALRAELAAVGIDSVDDIKQRRIGTRRTLQPLIQSYSVPANSDYFPFVDLNAAALRFKQQSAIDLPGLLTLPIPLMELLEGPMENASTPASPKSLLMRDALRLQSHAIRDGVSPLKLDTFGPSVTSILLILETDAERCRSAMARESWNFALRQLSDLTTPFLPASDTLALWLWIKARPCYRNLNDSERRLPNLLEAIAARNTREIATQGTNLLRAPSRLLNEEERAYVLLATAAAEIHNGSSAAAHDLLTRELISFEPPPLYRLALRQLTALSGGKR